MVFLFWLVDLQSVSFHPELLSNWFKDVQSGVLHGVSPFFHINSVQMMANSMPQAYYCCNKSLSKQVPSNSASLFPSSTTVHHIGNDEPVSIFY